MFAKYRNGEPEHSAMVCFSSQGFPCLADIGMGSPNILLWFVFLARDFHVWQI